MPPWTALITVTLENIGKGIQWMIIEKRLYTHIDICTNIKFCV